MKYNQPYDKPNDPNAPFTDADPTFGLDGSIIPGAGIEYTQREIVRTILDVGLATPSNNDLAQLSSAVRFMRLQYLVDAGVANNLLVTMDPAAVLWQTPLTFCCKIAITSTIPGVVCRINGIATSKPVVKRDNSALAIGDLIAGTVHLCCYDGTSVRILTMVPSDFPFIYLTAPKTLYVDDGIGSDTIYDGTTPTVSGPHGPFKTITKALTESRRYNLGGWNFTVYVATGTYDEYLELPLTNGSGVLYLIGNTAAPINCSISSPSGSCIRQREGGNYNIQGFELMSNGTVVAGDPTANIWQYAGQMDISNMNFFTSKGPHIGGGGRLNLRAGTLNIKGSAKNFIRMDGGIMGAYTPSLPDVAITAGITVSESFILLGGLSTLYYNLNSVSGAANVTGKAYDVTTNSVCFTSHAIPGSVVGTTDTGGQVIGP